MYDVLTEAEFKALYQQAVKDRAAGAKLTRWSAGDTSIEKTFTLNWQDGEGGAKVWSQLAAEARLRWPNKGRKRYTRSSARFCD